MLCYVTHADPILYTIYPYLLMLGPADVCCVGIGPGAGHVTELAAELVLGAPGRAGTSPSAAAATAAALGYLQGRLFLLVLLALQVLLVSLCVQACIE